MHGITLANPYDKLIHFNALARAIPAFKQYLLTTPRGTHTIDWQDDKAIRALTNALLERDFGLRVDLPEDRLCPIIPGRLEYVLWILEVAISTSISPSTSNDPLNLRGIDIGTGSSVIYPFLALRTFPTPHVLSFTATEIDPLSLVYAQRNIENNQLGQLIDLVRADEAGKIFDGCDAAFDFTMCNPPFYTSHDEVKELQSQKTNDPFSVCTGSSNEMITPGGEVQFVSRMIVESLEIGSRIRWFSSLLGKLSSVVKIIELLQQHKIDNYGIKETTQGQTKRWIIAWSLGFDRLSDSLARPTSQSLSKLIPPPNSHFYNSPSSSSIDPSSLRRSISTILDSLEISQSWNTPPQLTTTTTTATATTHDPISTAEEESADLLVWRNTWSREFRRKKARGEIDDVNEEKGREDVMLGLRIVLRWNVERVGGVEIGAAESKDEGMVTADGRRVVVELRWTRGKGEDRIGFKSLFAHLARRIADSTPIPPPPLSTAMDLT